MSMSSSSAAIISKPVVDALAELDLAGLERRPCCRRGSVSHESTWFRSDGPFEANGLSAAVAALPASAAPADG